VVEKKATETVVEVTLRNWRWRPFPADDLTPADAGEWRRADLWHSPHHDMGYMRLWALVSRRNSGPIFGGFILKSLRRRR